VAGENVLIPAFLLDIMHSRDITYGALSHHPEELKRPQAEMDRTGQSSHRREVLQPWPLDDMKKSTE